MTRFLLFISQLALLPIISVVASIISVVAALQPNQNPSLPITLGLTAVTFALLAKADS